MKKSSLLALSMVSLVALVGCGKSSGPSKISAEKFDKKMEAITEAWNSGSYMFAGTGTFKFKYSYKASGYAVDVLGNKPSAKGEGSFGIELYSDGQGGYLWYPVAEEGWEEEDFSDAVDLLDDAGLQYDFYWAPWMYMNPGQKMATAYESVGYSMSFYSNLSYKLSGSQEGETHTEGVSYKANFVQTNSFSKEGLLVKVAVKGSEVYSGSATGKLEYEDSYSVSYDLVDPNELA